MRCRPTDLQEFDGVVVAQAGDKLVVVQVLAKARDSLRVGPVTSGAHGEDLRPVRGVALHGGGLFHRRAVLTGRSVA